MKNCIFLNKSIDLSCSTQQAWSSTVLQNNHTILVHHSRYIQLSLKIMEPIEKRKNVFPCAAIQCCMYSSEESLFFTFMMRIGLGRPLLHSFHHFPKHDPIIPKHCQGPHFIEFLMYRPTCLNFGRRKMAEYIIKHHSHVHVLCTNSSMRKHTVH